MPTKKPTSEQFEAYQGLYDYFNGTLFNNELPAIILNFSRHSGACGFFAPNRWTKVKYTCPGCSLNVWGKPGLRIKCVDCDKDLEDGE
ncbi:MAG: hypothetical protein M1353_07940 [Nitrospirae bacterium]|nr:hypothetical protein [Nitrospirota bacterium]